jgi:hypothetical protein
MMGDRYRDRPNPMELWDKTVGDTVYLIKEKSERGYLVPTHHPFYASFILFTFCALPREKKTKKQKAAN